MQSSDSTTERFFVIIIFIVKLKMILQTSNQKHKNEEFISM